MIIEKSWIYIKPIDYFSSSYYIYIYKDKKLRNKIIVTRTTKKCKVFSLYT